LIELSAVINPLGKDCVQITRRRLLDAFQRIVE